MGMLTNIFQLINLIKIADAPTTVTAPTKTTGTAPTKTTGTAPPPTTGTAPTTTSGTAPTTTSGTAPTTQGVPVIREFDVEGHEKTGQKIKDFVIIEETLKSINIHKEKLLKSQFF